MGTRRGDIRHGLILWDARFGVDNLAANDGGALESDYSEYGPRPGLAQPLGAGTVYARDALEQPVTVECQVSGQPGQALCTIVHPTSGTGLGYVYYPRCYEQLHDASGGDLAT